MGSVGWEVGGGSRRKVAAGRGKVRVGRWKVGDGRWEGGGEEERKKEWTSQSKTRTPLRMWGKNKTNTYVSVLLKPVVISLWAFKTQTSCFKVKNNPVQMPTCPPTHQPTNPGSLFKKKAFHSKQKLHHGSKQKLGHV